MSRSRSDGSSLSQHFGQSARSAQRANAAASSAEHRIDIAQEILGDPEADDNLLERASTSFWKTVQDWSDEQKRKAVLGIALGYAVIGVAYVLIVTSTLSTSFSNPPLHYTSLTLSLLPMLLGVFLRVISAKMDMAGTPVKVWMGIMGVYCGGLVLLTIIAFHHDVIAVDENLRRYWSSALSDIDRSEKFHDSFEQLRALSSYHLHVLGGASCAVLILSTLLLFLLLALRHQILRHHETYTASTDRKRQYEKRWKMRQRMARLSAQMKERRRNRKLRGARALSSGGNVGPGGGLQPMFTGLGTGPQRGGSWSQDSAPENQDGDVQMTEIRLPSVSASSSAVHPLPSSSLSSSVPLLPHDADEQRYEGMLSEDIENELEREEQKREAQGQQQ